jgi:hypothetical protein
VSARFRRKPDLVSCASLRIALPSSEWIASDHGIEAVELNAKQAA